MSSCPHLGQLVHLREPLLSQSVHREECTQCFDNQDDPAGVEVCLSCFNGGCLNEERHHARTHVHRTGHTFSLNVQRTPKVSSNRTFDDEPPAKITKLAIVEERDEDKYDTNTTITCWACDPQTGSKLTTLSGPERQIAENLTTAVMSAMSSARQSEVKAWEEEIAACEHTFLLQQIPPDQGSAPALEHCSRCDLKENLWLCMICGSLGCGRKQFGASGGNGHGLQHFEETGHGISVKLGTITPEGEADVYCYICNDTRLDPELAVHLSTFGINVQNLSKTEKTMTELNIEHNLKYDFSVVGEDGQALEALAGPGLTGLSNLGNSCYMSSVLQTLFAFPAFQNRYGHLGDHAETCTVALPADCVECQMRKIADGLLSGRYAVLSHKSDGDQTSAAAAISQVGIRPVAFKALVGRGHSEFSTMKQQDAEEFLVHLLDIIRREERKRTGGATTGREPSEIFTFGMEERLECGRCNRVRYRVDKMDVVSVPVPADRKPPTGDQGSTEKEEWEPVRFEDCLALLTVPEALEYDCPSCSEQVFATKHARFASFPEVLVVHAKKFQLVNWVPTKLDVPLIVPDGVVLDEHVGRGIQPGEVELPGDHDSNVESPAEPQFDASALAMLEGMGFPSVRCKKALLATGNGSDAQAAMEWLFAHMDDPDIDDPMPSVGAGQNKSAFVPSDEQVGMLAEMGFTSTQARKALRETTGNTERAVEWLFSHPDDTGEDSAPAAAPATAGASDVGGSKDLPAAYRLKAFVSHKGPSVHSGHYVAHIRTTGGGWVQFNDEMWVLFNDEKVVKADGESVEELRKLAYLYFFEKV